MKVVDVDAIVVGQGCTSVVSGVECCSIGIGITIQAGAVGIMIIPSTIFNWKGSIIDTNKCGRG